MIIKKRQSNKAFTLVETLVSVAIFSLLSVGIVNVFVSALKTQSRILQSQLLMEQGNYVLDYMTKAIRMAKKDTVGGCVTINENYAVGSSPASITFLSYDTKAAEYRCRRFILSGDAIMEQRSSDATSASLSSAVAITSSKVKITNLSINVRGDVTSPADDLEQPLTTIMVVMEPSSQLMSASMKVTVQTSVSERQLDI